MPEIKRVFTSGRMNKDLDERLIPNGEYRDALNVQLATSEGSNVGTIQNVLGNIKLSSINSALTSGGVLAATTRQIVGVGKDEETSKIYFFIHVEIDGSTTQVTDIIAEYDEVTNNTSPVVTDTSGILKFKTGKYITGINVLDGFLYYTDNENEPKQIEIEKFKRKVNNAAPFYNGMSFTLEEITVIKKSPWQPPNMTLSDEKAGANELLVYNNLPELNPHSFYRPSQVKPGSNTLQPGDTFLFGFSGENNFHKNDVLRLEGNSGEVIIRIRLTKSLPYGTISSRHTWDATIISITSNAFGKRENFGIFRIFVEASEPLFELKFPRFAYRWKYSNNQMSSMSPFTDVAFLPDKDNGFNYDPLKSYNKSMKNTVKKITLNNFVTPPSDVTDLEILYKESDSTNVYIIAKLKVDETSVDIVSEQIQGLLESNQLLRTYDNVPLKAKSQDIVGNRLVYGNYVQNFNVTKPVVVDTTLISKNIDGIKPTKSVKSQRKYQLGIVYIDEFGRKTPVFTNDAKVLADAEETSEVSVPVFCCDTSNSLQVQVNSQLPDSTFEKYFQYYIKENSNEYYNLALDSWYYDKEDYIWLSFQSAERNKLETGDYLILKKLHGEDKSIIQGRLDVNSLKYKVIDIKNTPPDFVKKEEKIIGEIKDCQFVNDSSNSFIPQEDVKIFRIQGSDIHSLTKVIRGALSDLTAGTQEGLYVKFALHDVQGAATKTYESKKYEIESIKITDAGNNSSFADANDRYEFSLKETFESDVSFIPQDFTNYSTFESGEIHAIFSKEISMDESDFASKFFVKVEKNNNLEFSKQRILSQKSYVQLVSKKVVIIDANDHALGQDAFVTDSTDVNFAIDLGKWYETELESSASTAIQQAPNYTNLKGQREVILRHFDSSTFQPNNYGNYQAKREAKRLHDVLTSTRTLYIRFDDHNPATSVDRKSIYKINSVTTYPVHNYNDFESKAAEKFSSNRGYRYKLTLDNPITYDPISDGGKSVNDFTGNKITKIAERYDYNKMSVVILEEEIPDTGENEKNPAIFETEPKAQEVDLNIWHEAGPAYPVTGLTNYINVKDVVTGFNTAPGVEITVEAMNVDGVANKIKLSSNSLSSTAGKILTFTNPSTGAAVTQEVQSVSQIGSGKLTMKTDNHGRLQTLSWFNCFAFGNGVESNRIRDDFNAVTIDKGPKVSATLSEPYNQERRKNGLIYSGIYNSNSSINELNQFNTALKITKDLNPTYGNIQKIYTRNTDLIALCEDKVLKILANKDALFNADGNVNLIATENVLGQAIPFAGDYGISKNPESFASHGYRIYFADKKRGAILRLSMDGITNISDVGMRDYFMDNLKESSAVVGSYDISTDSYNITLNNDTVSYTELTKGWLSRKSFLQEAGISLNSTYYTFAKADIWSHNNPTRNTFYGDPAVKSTVNVILNEVPSSIKNFKTINYEGSKDWKATEITSDQQSGKVTHFKDKENKFFNYIKGTSQKSVTIKFVDNNNSNFKLVDDVVIQKAVGSSVNDIITFTVKPKEGYQVASSISGFTYQGTDTKVTSVTNIEKTNINEDTSVASAITFKVNLSGFTMPSSDVVINIPFNTTGSLEGIKYKLSGAVINEFRNATGSLANLSVIDTSGTYGSTVTVATQTITPNTSFSFNTPPNFDKRGVKVKGNWTSTRTGPDANGAYTITVKYTYPSEDSVGNVVIFNASGNSTIANTTNKIYGASILVNDIEDDETPITAGGETRIVRVHGDNTSQFKISVYNTANNNSILTLATKTIGSELYLDVPVTFPAIGNTNTEYAIKLEEVNSGDFVDEFDATQTGGDGIVIFTLNQYVNSQVTFGLDNAPVGLTVVNVSPHLSSYSITGSGGSELEAVDVLPLLFKVTSSQNISLDQFYPYYQHFSRVANTTATTTGGSVTNTTFTIANANANILAGMVVTGTGISGYVYVESISGTTLVLSGSVTLNNATLTFSGLDTTKQQLVLDSGSIVKFGRSTVTIDNSGGTKSAIFSMNAFVVKYGTANATTNLHLGNVFNLTSGTPNPIPVTVSKVSQSNNLISSISLTSGNTVSVGTAAGTVITGTGTMVGNFNNLTSSQLDQSYLFLVGFNDSTGSDITPTFSGTGTSTQTATFNWSMRLSSEVTSSSTLSFKVHTIDATE